MYQNNWSLFKKIKKEQDYFMTKEQTNKELAQEIVNRWNQKQEDETKEEFKKELKTRNKYKYEYSKDKNITSTS